MLKGKTLQAIIQLKELADTTGQNKELFVQKILYQLSIQWDLQTALNLYAYLYNNLKGSDFIEDVFELPSQGDVQGELLLGNVKGKSSVEFRHLISKLPLHILAAGTSGSGKTNFAKILVEQALFNGVETVRISDPKSEYNDIAVKYPEFLVLRWNDLRFNPFKPPPNVPKNEWQQTVIGHMSQSFNFWEGAISLFLKLIYAENEKGKCPNVFSLLKAVREYHHQFYYKDLVVMSTVASRLELLAHVCGEVVSSDGDMLTVLRNRNYILQTTGLMPEIESWLLEYLLMWEFNYRLFNPSDSGFSLHIYDECQHRLFNSEKEKNIKKISSSVISMLVDEARSSNIGICALSQEPSVLIKSILNNSWLKVVFHLGSGEEVKIMKGAMGLNQDQADTIHYLELGEGIIRTGGGVFIEPCPVIFHEFEKPGRVWGDDFYNHQQAMKHRLYKESGIEEGKGLDGNLAGTGIRQNDWGVSNESSQSEIDFEEEFDVLT
ncbi:MAG: ATP-binding protein [Candidatus Neomarinimicrobiota bacterium]